MKWILVNEMNFSEWNVFQWMKWTKWVFNWFQTFSVNEMNEWMNEWIEWMNEWMTSVQIDHDQQRFQSDESQLSFEYLPQEENMFGPFLFVFIKYKTVTLTVRTWIAFNER